MSTDAGTPDAQARAGSFFLLRPVRRRLYAVTAAALLGSAATVLPFVGIVEIVRALLASDEPDTTRVWAWASAVVISTIVRSASTGLAGLLSHAADNDLQRTLRRRIVAHIRRLPLGWLASRQSSGVVKAVEHDVEVMHQLVGHTVQDLTLGVGVPLLSLAYLFCVEWRMALAALLPTVLAFALMGAMMSTTAGSKDEYDQATTRLAASVIELVHGIVVVKAFGHEEATSSAYQRAVDRYVQAWRSWTRRTGPWLIASEVLSSPVLSLLILTATGSWLVAQGTGWLAVLPGVLVGMGLAGPVLQLATSTESIMDAAKAHDSIVDLVSTPTIPEADAPQPAEGSDIQLDEVGFSYDGDHEALHQVTLSCPAGSTTALVGPSGSGKTTLARLVPRFYDVTSGSVRLGRTDVRQLSREDLYGSVSMVFQDPYLLRASVRDNICLTRPGCPRGVMVEAARTAQIHHTIMGYPRGYDSVVGHDAHVSGGEAQRLSIARALVAEAPVLVLDEATAFADPDSEALIQRAISAVTATRTVIVIAHRLHTVTGCDNIVVLEGGQVAEQGRHEQLVAAGGLYHRLWSADEDTSLNPEVLVGAP